MELLSAAAIRRCLRADRGMSIFTADFNQIEFRIAAALSGEQSLIDGAKRGESPLKTVAIEVFGGNHSPDEYRYAKNLGYGWIFGGGPDTLAGQTGLEFARAQGLIKDFEEKFPNLTRYKRRKQDECLRGGLTANEYKMYRSLKSRMYNYRTTTEEGRRARQALQREIDRLVYGKVYYVRTPFGRELPVDLSKPYAIVNYEVQSCAADLMKRALLDVMADRELEPTVLLPIHDELLGQTWKHKAEYMAQRYGEVMTREFEGVPITASGKVYGPSWGHGYMSKD